MESNGANQSSVQSSGKTLEITLTQETLSLLGAMSEKLRWPTDVVVDYALQQMAQREGVVEEVRAREDLKEAFRRLGNLSEPRVSWSELKGSRVSEAPYAIEFAAAAAAEWKRLPLNLRDQLATAIDALAQNPEPADATLLKGLGSLYRIRAGSHHLTYVVQSAVIMMLLIKAGKRG